MPAGRIRHERFHPSPEFAPFIEHFWNVSWDFADQPAHRVATLPHPSVHLVFERGNTALGGVRTGRFSRLLADESFVFGVKFRPASFHAFYGRDLSTLTNREIDPASVFGPTIHALEERVLSCAMPADRLRVVEEFLRVRLPEVDPLADRLNRLIAYIVHTPGIVRAEQLEPNFGGSLRRLQRLFRRYVGVSPKWVIARYRIHEALERIHRATPISWAALATDLGYSDQAHFIRDFKVLVGQTPGAYSRALRLSGTVS